MSATTLTRAYAVLHVKSVDEGRRRIAGIASTPEADRMGDVVEPLGITFKNPVPLLLYHDTRKPVGHVTFKAPTADGLEFDAELPVIAEAGTLRDRVEEAWQSLQTGLLGGVSIGFRALEEPPFDKVTGGFRFLKSEVLELSLVTIPANAGATVHTIKSLDLAATGRNLPGVSGLPVPALARARPMEKQQVADQISAFEATRQAKAARMLAIMALAAGEHLTLDEAQKKEYDDLEREVDAVDAHLVRLRKLETQTIAGATRLEPGAGATGAAASAARSGSPVIQVRSTVPKGTAFVRMVCAQIVCRGNKLEAAEYAQRWKDSTPEVSQVLKAAIAPGTILDPAWAAPLAARQILTDEFLELLRPATIIGKIPGLRKVPFNVGVPAQTAGGTYGWVGEGKPKPLTNLGFGSVTLDVAKAAGIIVITMELAKLSSPSAEALVRADMIAGIAQFLDGQFIDPAVAAVANVHPASITNGLTPIVSTDNALQDLVALLNALSIANVPLGGVTLIMSETNGLMMGLARDAMGARIFPGMGAGGGTAEGLTVVTSNTAGQNVIALQPSRVLYADEGGVEIDVSHEASLQMDSAPASPADATTVLVSLWQNNLVGLRAERMINWKRADAVSVAIATGATYVTTVSGTGTGAATPPTRRPAADAGKTPAEHGK